jgi:hypothetical protein
MKARYHFGMQLSRYMGNKITVLRKCGGGVAEVLHAQ